MERLKTSNDIKLAKVQKKLRNARDVVQAEKAKWSVRLENLNKDLDHANDRTYLEKKRRRNAVSVQVQRSNGEMICVFLYA